MKIGEIMPLEREIVLNEGKPSLTVLVANTGDRPVQVGSHFHFFEVNKCLSFDREKTYGYHHPGLRSGLSRERKRKWR